MRVTRWRPCGRQQQHRPRTQVRSQALAADRTGEQAHTPVSGQVRRTVEGMRSGELAEAGGVHVETLRYYERRGLLAEPPRRGSGYRDYPVDALHRLRMIKQAQVLGLSLEEIADLLTVNPHAQVPCGAMEAQLRSKIKELEDKLAALSDLRSSLDSLLRVCCDGRQSERACPALGQDRSDG